MLIDDLVAVADADALARLIGAVGTGDAALDRALRNALSKRARRPSERRRLFAAVEQELNDATPARRGGLYRLWFGLGGKRKPDSRARLVAAALEPATPFVSRVTLLRLAARSEGAAPDALEPALDAWLEQGDAGAVLVAESLPLLPRERAEAWVTRHHARQHVAPNVAAAAHRATAPADAGAWLGAALAHPWPMVHSAAIDRLGATCDARMRRTLAARLHDRAGETVRSAANALGRCGGERALQEALVDANLGDSSRVSIARALVRDGGEPGTEAVAALLGRHLDPSLASQLAKVLRRTPYPSAAVPALCAQLDSVEVVAHQAARSLQALTSDGTEACHVP